MEDESIRLSMPSPNRTIWSSVGKWSNPLSSVFHLLIKTAEEEGLQKEIADRYRYTFSPIIPIGDDFSFKPRQGTELASASLLSIWMLSRIAHRKESTLSLAEAERWFLEEAPPRVLGVSNIDGWPPKNCLRPLLSLSYQNDFVDLFPYILETFEIHPNGPPSSQGALLSKSERKTRLVKRENGIFYTPSDVAEYIAEEVLDSWKEDNRKKLGDFNCLDPACGTGVFLLALLREMKSCSTDGSFDILNFAVRCLYGMDVSPQAVQSSTFVILSECLRDTSDKIPLWNVWQAIRGNFAVKDSTKIYGTGKPRSPKNRDMQKLRMKIRQTLLHSNQEIGRQWLDQAELGKFPSGSQLDHIFGEISEGFSAVIGNPPYSKFPTESLSEEQRNEFVSSNSGKLYTLFVEMMWKFAKKTSSASGMIIPLSIAYHSGKAYKALRCAIQNTQGEWTFHFFDRTPDSIFGDDIKTRNAIIFFKQNDTSKNRIKSTELIRWNSRNRSSLFENLQAQSLQSISIEKLIPKIGCKEELSAYQTLRSHRNKISDIGKSLPPSSMPPSRKDENLCIYAYRTAYNWLPIFRNMPMSDDETHIPKSIQGLIFENEKDSKFFFAVASSHLAYWLWRVEGDGFHLNKSFLLRLPFHPEDFSSNALRRIEKLADGLWSELQQHPIKNKNSGRETFNYCPYKCTGILNEIDRIIISTYGIDRKFLAFLEKFLVRNIVVDREEEGSEYKEISKMLSNG